MGREAAVVAHIGLDEKSFGKGQDYITVLTDLDGSRVLDVTARAWALKEEFRWFWRHVYALSAEEFFDHWYAWGARCRLKPMVKVAKMLKRHLPNLLTYFRHRITNATSEGFNSVIQALRYAARGFRSFANYRTRILFYWGKLNLMPQRPCH